MSLDDNTEPPTSPSPSIGCESVEVTGVLAITAFSATLDFDPKWSVSQVANDLLSRLSDSTQQLFELDLPVDLRGLDIFKCRFCTIHSSRLSRSVTYTQPLVFNSLVVSRNLSLRPRRIKKRRLNTWSCSTYRPTMPMSWKHTLKITKKTWPWRVVIVWWGKESDWRERKGRGKKRTWQVSATNPVSPPTIWEYDFFHVESSDSLSQSDSQIYKVLQKLEEYDDKFSKQERTNEELKRMNEGLQRAIVGLSTNAARVSQSYTSSLWPQLDLSNHPS